MEKDLQDTQWTMKVIVSIIENFEALFKMKIEDLKETSSRSDSKAREAFEQHMARRSTITTYKSEDSEDEEDWDADAL